MLRFLILSLFILTLTACGTTYKIPGTQEKNKEEQQIVNPYFNQINKEYSYRFNITFMKKEMKGNFVVKKLGEDSHRAVMTSDFGNTLFDLSISQDKYILHYAMPDLNKKVVVKTLAEDLQTILKNDFQLDERIKTSTNIILKSKDVSLIFDPNETNYFHELVRLKNNKIKTINQFSSNQSDFPERIFIKHNHFNLSIELNKVNIELEEE
ncbi:hypothetical protein [Empedobacter brevis]|uniref:hypothetical protein n=1 Tax=Empedobacter brevis TaxID=247 RepID=UPI00289BE709|nr:hypothetical protein [Empedobacter brevis]